MPETYTVVEQPRTPWERFYNNSPARKALLFSRNIPAVEVGQMEGMDNVINLAHEMGILTRAVEPGDLDETIREFETQLVHKSPLVIKLGLRAFAAQEDLDLEQALKMLRERFANVLETEDAHEGLAAFLEKRAPVWRGR